MVHDHLCSCKGEPQLNRGAGQVLPAEVGRLVCIIRTAPGQADARGVVARSAFRTPVNRPARIFGGKERPRLAGTIFLFSMRS